MAFELEEDGIVGPFESNELQNIQEFIHQLDLKKNGYKNIHISSGLCRQLISSTELASKVQQYFGDELKLWRTNVFKKEKGSGEIAWHHDRHFEDGDSEINFSNLQNHYSILLALTDMNEDTGLMEFIPTSHLPSSDFKRDARPFHKRTLNEHFLSLPSGLVNKRVKVPLKKGQFMLFHSGTLHRSLPAKKDKEIKRYALVARLCTQQTNIPATLAQNEEVYDYPMSMDKNKTFLDKVVLVSGGTAGIGKAIARAFLEEGAKVCILGRNKERLDKTTSEFKKYKKRNSLLSLQADVSVESQVKDAIKHIEVEYGRLDIVFANAATNNVKGPLASIDLDIWQEEVISNILATSAVCKCSTELMKKAGGNIIILGSGIGHEGAADNSAYAISKAANWVLTQTLAKELLQYNINVNELIPGPVITAMNPNAHGPQWKRPEDIIEIAMLLAKQNLRFGATGQSWAMKRK